MEAGLESMCRKMIKQTNPNSESERISQTRQTKQSNYPKDGFEEEGYPQNRHNGHETRIKTAGNERQWENW